ncbi:MAG: sulfotransferase domain-containing protein [Synechocystis sp.]|nr:sulfotransferase domain-containing protein [Synechocystis sp.]
MLKNTIRKIIYPVIKSRPDFLVIGTQKAGTTSLYNYLIQHPQMIKNKSWKEVRYYDLPENYCQGWGWYLSQFPSKREKGSRLTCDTSPSYLYFPHIPPLIKQDLGDIKMIAILREPTSRAYSAWKMYHSFGTNADVAPINQKIADRRSFPEAIEQELSHQLPENIYPYDYIGRGRYAEQLERYFTIFPRENFLVLESKQLQNSLTETLTQVCEFIGIDPFSEELLGKLSEEKYNVGLRKEPSDDIQATLNQLKDYYRPYNETLYQLLGQRYDW